MLFRSPYNGQLVSIGGDNSKFIIHFHKELIDYTILSENRTGKEKLVLLSHAYLTAEDIKHVCFAITETQPFRFLKTTVDTQNYTILSQKVTRSEKYNLYKAGSVFYFNDKDALETLKTALENKKNFRQIGYNQYQIIRTK